MSLKMLSSMIVPCPSTDTHSPDALNFLEEAGFTK